MVRRLLYINGLAITAVVLFHSGHILRPDSAGDHSAGSGVVGALAADVGVDALRGGLGVGEFGPLPEADRVETGRESELPAHLEFLAHPFGQEHFQQRLIRHVPLVGQELEFRQQRRRES